MAVILAVDDDADVLDLLMFALEAAGHHVLTAPDGPTALTVTAGRRVDLVVTDFHMPGMTGVQLAQTLRSAPETSQIPVVMVSAVAGPERDPHCAITRWLPKPFSPRQLRAEIADLLAPTATERYAVCEMECE